MPKIPFFPQEQEQKDNQEKLHDILLCEDELTSGEQEFISDIMESIDVGCSLTDNQQDYFNTIWRKVT